MFYATAVTLPAIQSILGICKAVSLLLSISLFFEKSS
jgi:hypothetical protein